ncbi:MAG: hypothetical protein ACI8UO_000262 [Verrucomicrobiales bacterium]|jgi:hypothetical protein
MTRLRALLAAFLFTSAASADEATEKLVLATYKLFNESSTATGFIVKTEDRSFLVTSAHVFEKMEGSEFLLVARRKQDSGEFTRLDVPIPLRKKREPLWKKHADHDIAILALSEDIDEPGIPLESLAEDSGMTVGDDLRTIVFPERFEANGAGFPTLRGGFVASYPLTPKNVHALFLIDMTSWGGDSGGPVQLVKAGAENPIIVGILAGKHQITDTKKESRYVERKIDYPLNISYAVHASFARKMIEDELAD